MDRSKSRTDLLQAGRKKLQQFRQKKDSKGGSSRGKSSKKSDKAQPPKSDADGRSSPSMSIASSQVTDGNVETDSDSNMISRESFESQSLTNSLSPDNFDHVDSSSVAITNSTCNEIEMGSDSKLALQDQRVREIDSDLFSQDQEKGFKDVIAAKAEDVSLRTSDSLGPEDGATNDHVYATVDILSPPTSVVTAVGEPVTVKGEDDKREESLLLSEDILDTSLMKTRENQDPDGVDLKKSFQSTDVEEASIEAKQLGKSVEVVSSTEDVVADNLSASDQGLGDGIATGGPMRNLEGETLSRSSYNELLLQSSQEQISEEALSGHDSGLQEGCNQQWTPAVSAVVDPTHELSMGSHEVNLARPLDVSPILGTSSVDLLQLAEIIRGLNEEEYHFLLNLRGSVFDADPLAISLVLPDHDFSEAFQRLKEELFLANLMKNIFNMELAEQLELQLQSDNQHCQLVDEVSQLQASHNEVNEKNQHLIEELANCCVELQDVSRKSAELQNQFNIDKAEVEALSARVVELQISFEMSQQDSLDLSTELADCRALISALQAEKKGMNENLKLVVAEKNKLVEEREFHLYESKKLATELADFKCSMEGVTVENSKLTEGISLVTEERDKIKEEIEHLSNEIERLSLDLAHKKDLVASLQAENSNLNGKLASSTERIKHLEGENQPEDIVNRALFAREQSQGLHIATTEDSLCMDQQAEEGAPGGPTLNLLEYFFDDSLGFVSLKSCLDEMEKILVKLEKGRIEFYSQSASFSRFGEKVSSPVVSKLIQAFESKRHEDEHEVDERDSKEVQSSSNSFNMLVKEETGNLRKLLSKWQVHVQSAGALFKGVQDARKIGDTKYSVLKDQFEELKQHCSNSEASNIELTVQWEAAVQLLGEIQETKCHLEELFEALNQEETHLKAKNIELYEKLGRCQTKVGEMYTEICDVKQSSNEMASVIFGQLENLQKEVTRRAMLLEQGWNTTIAEIIELVGKLNESVGKTLSSIPSSDARYISHQLAISVNAATETIFDLQKKLEATCSEHEIICSTYKELNLKCDDLLSRNELAAGVLHKMYNDLSKLVFSHSGSMNEDKIDLQSEALPDLLNYNSYQAILNCLADILNEKLELESITNERKSELEQKEAELKELKIKSLGLDPVCKLIEDIASILNVEHSKLEINKAPLSCLDSLVSSLVEKTREAEIQLQMSKEGYGSKETELDELKKKIHCQETLCFEKENDILVLKESLHQTEEALTAARSELQEKINELEHSEQRVSFIREKLSIAVARGKGLVVQRDGLKQSLADTSRELERCLEELHLKDARLYEVEEKLKIYAEAGERMEAMESELSYIRNSSNSLRESFLLKDSMLQRIEEVLEDLDLPEQFHSGDIIEKIDWLARSVVGNSLPMNDWERKDYVGGGSYSDAGYVATDSWKDGSHLPPDSGDDSWKDDSQLQADSEDVLQHEQQQPPCFVPLDGDDLSKKFEELHSKFYGLAEQNEMLEQSLMERNNLVQRWEELVDRIDMPSHLRSMEMEDKIEWVGRALAEANHHVDSLQLKIERYDSHCGLLNSDLEVTQRTVSALQTDLRAIITEREHLSEKLEALIFECEKLSAQARQAELENEVLHNEIASLKDILEQKVALEKQIFTIEGKLRNLRDLVSDVLPESDTKNLVSANANIDSLEKLVRKLTEAFMIKREHPSEKLEALECECEKLSAQARQAELQNETLHSEIASLKDILEQKVAIEEQIFTIDGKLRNLQDMVNDVLPKSETINMVSGKANIDFLEELLSKLIENHASLQSMKPTNGVELDGDHPQKDDATHVEARSIDMHDKEEADIDRYKKDLEEALSELEHVKEERDRTLEKQISLSSGVEALCKKIEELQELLNQEEQKSASVREKLNLAVRKGKSLVQQRDSLKQTIEGMSIEMEHLKYDINNRENEHAQKLRQMSTYPEKLEALECESMCLKNHLAETEHHLQEREYSLQLVLNKLGEIEVSGAGHISDPVKKLECVGKLCSDLHGTVATLEQESMKSRRASELLLAELNEVQERNDAFQEELTKVAAELVDLRKDKDSAEAGRLEAISHLEKLSALHEEGKESHISEIMGLKSSINQLCKDFGEVQHLLANAFLMDLESLQNLEASLDSCMKGNNAKNVVDSSVAKKRDGILPRSSNNKKSSLSLDSWSDIDTIDHSKDDTIVENFHLRHQLQEILAEINSFKERIAMHSSLVQEQDKSLSKLMVSVEREITSQRESCETMRRKISEQDGELVALRGNIDYLYKACIAFVTVIENGKGELVGNKVEFSNMGINLKTPPFDDGISEENIKTLTDRLQMAAKEVTSIRTEGLAANQNEMKATITNMQLELQEKDVQRERICSQLVKQIKDAEAAANDYCQDLQSVRIQEQNFKKQVEVIEAERKILEHRVNELQASQGTAAELKIRSQTDLLAAKDQEIEALMHALDEEEVQMEELTKKIEELEKIVQQKSQEIENLESSRGKVMKKLAITVSKFDELHHLSASLLSEVEKHQSQLQERDAEISFLRQEVTRCTNDVLLALQMSNQRSSDEIFDFLMWVDMMVSQEGMHDMHPDVKSYGQVHEYKEIIHKKLMSVLSESENLKSIAESKDAILQVERKKVEELSCKVETLETSLHEKEMQLDLLEGVEETGKGANTNSENFEVEPVTNEWAATGTFVTPQVRSLRKGNNDHVAIAVDEDPVSASRIEDEEDDKVHGFKSLSSSKIVPRYTRPLTDLIDGLWVSCDRTLMRRPILRLGIIMYWAIMHALLAFFVV